MFSELLHESNEEGKEQNNNLINKLEEFGNKSDACSTKEEDIKNENKFFHYNCEKCKYNLLITFPNNNLNYITIQCKCKYKENFQIKDFKEYQKHEEIINLTYCKKEGHKNQPFVFYCVECKMDLCPDCLEEKDPESGVITHSTHTKIKLFDVRQKIKDKVLDKKTNKEPLFNFLLKEFLNNNKDYPTINIKKSFENTAELIKKYEKNYVLFLKSNLKDEDRKIKELNKYDSYINLVDGIKDSELIYSIIIIKNDLPQKFDIFNFKDKQFTNLKTLTLISLNIQTIEPFSGCEFPQLEVLDLAKNQIDDNCFDTLEKMKLPKIKFLSFYNNEIHSIRIFEKIKKYNTLETFYIGYNSFKLEKELIELNNGKRIELNKNLKELGISNVFDKKSNKYIQNFDVENLEILYIYMNKLSSLEIFEKMKFEKLKEIWINRVITKENKKLEDIKAIKFLKKFKNIEKINLRNNKIKIDIKDKNKKNDFINFINQFTKLKELHLENNDISMNDIKGLPVNIREKIIIKN